MKKKPVDKVLEFKTELLAYSYKHLKSLDNTYKFSFVVNFISWKNRIKISKGKGYGIGKKDLMRTLFLQTFLTKNYVLYNLI